MKSLESEVEKYSEVLRAMMSDAKLMDLGARNRRTRTGEMILELKRVMERKGAVYTCLAQEVLGEGVEEVSVGRLQMYDYEGENPKRDHQRGRTPHGTAATVQGTCGLRNR